MTKIFLNYLTAYYISEKIIDNTCDSEKIVFNYFFDQSNIPIVLYITREAYRLSQDSNMRTGFHCRTCYPRRFKNFPCMSTKRAGVPFTSRPSRGSSRIEAKLKWCRNMSGFVSRPVVSFSRIKEARRIESLAPSSPRIIVPLSLLASFFLLLRDATSFSLSLPMNPPHLVSSSLVANAPSLSRRFSRGTRTAIRSTPLSM